MSHQQLLQRALPLLLIAMLSTGIFRLRSADAVESVPLSIEQLAQDGQATSAPVQLPSATPEPTLTQTPSNTPTSQGPAFVEALNPDANVRSGPGLDFDRLGTIQPGEQYVIIGREFDWYQIEFPNTPAGRAWVFSGVIRVIGDESQIVDLSQQDIPTIDPAIAAAAETQLAITRTPGGILTVTADAALQSTSENLFTTTAEPTTTLAPGERLPTFTFPAITNTALPIEQLQQTVTVSDAEQEPFAPAIPVLGLIGLGLFGLLVGVLRRV